MNHLTLKYSSGNLRKPGYFETEKSHPRDDSLDWLFSKISFFFDVMFSEAVRLIARQLTQLGTYCRKLIQINLHAEGIAQPRRMLTNVFLHLFG